MILFNWLWKVPTWADFHGRRNENRRVILLKWIVWCSIWHLLILFNWLWKVPILAGFYGRRNEITVSTDGREFCDFLSDCEQVNEELLHETIQ